MVATFKNEIVLLFGLVCAYLLLYSTSLTGLFGLWGSLVALISVSIYYSSSFFRSEQKLEKLVFFVISMFFVIGYFALVYKVFGIIDSTSNEKVNPSWMNAFYFGTVTWTTLGYGDFRPIDDLKVWVMVEATMGYLYMGLFVGKVLHMFQHDAKV